MIISPTSALKTIARAAFGLSALILVAGAPAPTPALAQGASPTVPVDELMKPNALPDLVYGDPKAKITIVEYASMTCPHCARFHNEVFPELKKKYIDSGKVKLVYREFPLDNLAAGASMLARCASSPEKTKKMIDVLMKKQASWAFVRSNPLPPLFKIAKQAGFTQKTFDACLKNQKLLTSLSKQRARASKVFGVNSTPHFFINGKRLGNGSLSGFEKAIAEASKG